MIEIEREREREREREIERVRVRERERERERERITDTRYGSENQTKKNELAWMGIELMAFGLALRRSNHWATETPHLNQHIQLRYHPTADNVPVAWIFSWSDPKVGMLPASDTCVTFFLPRKEFVQGPVSTGLPFLLFPTLSPFLNFFPFMEGQWKLVPKQSLLRVKNVMRVTLFPLFPTHRWSLQCTRQKSFPLEWPTFSSRSRPTLTTAPVSGYALPASVSTQRSTTHSPWPPLLTNPR